MHCAFLPLRSAPFPAPAVIPFPLRSAPAPLCSSPASVPAPLLLPYRSALFPVRYRFAPLPLHSLSAQLRFSSRLL